ncbi:N-acetylmannosamine-6-phosphate 2-epimerase [Mycetocola zhadangensis]|uniref:N-acetylmannosamine-6-phosphate 2-epimerase n=1 Tax=Mycetocola zhadangensis TaxID=1164595 RepID=UPI003A4D629B
MTNPEMLKNLRGRLVVSCQAYPGEPLRDPRAMALMAQAAVEGGAAAIRAQGLEDIRLIRRAVTVPQIGLLKVGSSGVFITPTLQDALDVVEAGSEVVAIDGTRRERPDGLTLEQTIAEIHARTNAMVMADVGSFDDGIAAQEAGADIVGTTLAGYTPERQKTDGPDLELLEQLAGRLDLPVFAEGRIHTPEQARLAIEAGAYSVVVGTAITHPTTITSWFAAAVAG